MRRDVYFVHEDFSLRQALAAFYRTHHPLFIVVNEFEEYVGVLTIETVVEQLLGRPLPGDEMEAYDSARSVAEAQAKDRHRANRQAGHEPAEAPEANEAEEKVEIIE